MIVYDCTCICTLPKLYYTPATIEKFNNSKLPQKHPYDLSSLGNYEKPENSPTSSRSRTYWMQLTHRYKFVFDVCQPLKLPLENINKQIGFIAGVCVNEAHTCHSLQPHAQMCYAADEKSGHNARSGRINAKKMDYAVVSTKFTPSRGLKPRLH